MKALEHPQSRDISCTDAVGGGSSSKRADAADHTDAVAGGVAEQRRERTRQCGLKRRMHDVAQEELAAVAAERVDTTGAGAGEGGEGGETLLDLGCGREGRECGCLRVRDVV